MNNSEIVVQCRFGDEEVGDRDPVPHPMVVGEVALQAESACEDVIRCSDRFEAGSQRGLVVVVFVGRTGGVELFQFANRTDK